MSHHPNNRPPGPVFQIIKNDPPPMKALPRPLMVLLLAAALALTQVAHLSAQSAAKKDKAAAPAPVERKPDVVFVPTPQVAVDKMLEMCEIKKGDVLYDLGCGDGRIVVTAAKKYGIKAIGVDIDPERVKESQDNVKKAGVEHLVTIKQADIFELDFSDASVVTMYLLPDLNVKLSPKLAKLKPGTRIVSHDFDMNGAKPKETIHLDTDRCYDSTIYKWVVPWEKE
jgi:SAM-dependent methyltransferase